MVAVSLAGCSSSSEASGDIGTGPAKGEAIEVAAGDRIFTPKVLELGAGKEVTIEVTNEDGAPHDFAIPDIELNTGRIDPGKIKTATFEVPSGTTRFVCTYHAGMEGTIKTG